MEITKSQKYLFLLSVFFSGFYVLLIEIIGTKFFSPFFGTTIFVWSSLIVSTLGSLTIGYWLGAKSLLKTNTGLDVFYKTLLKASLASSLIPLESKYLYLLNPLGLKLAPLIGAFIVFTPALTFLAIATTIGVDIYGKIKKSTSEAPGFIFALSTLGSISGALITVFIFIPLFSISLTLIGFSLIFAILNSLGLSLFKKNLYVNIFVLLIASILFLQLSFISVEKNIFSAQSFYGEVTVKNTDSFGKCMFVDRVIQGCDYSKNKLALSLFHKLLTPTNSFTAKQQRVLFMGLGVGVGPMILLEESSNPFLEISAVEIDPVILKVAVDYFGLDKDKIKIHIEDARTFLKRNDTKYDLIVMDLYKGASTDPSLWSQEMFQEINKSLASDGVLSMNIPQIDLEGNELTHDINTTIKHTFPFVNMLSIPGTFNLVLYASQKPLAKNLGDESQDLGRLITDDHNWVEQKYANTAIEIISLSQSIK